MKWAIQTIVVFLVGAGLCWAAGYETKGKAGPYGVVATFDQAKPVEGTNRLRIAVTDSAARPVKDAKVNIEYLMPSLPLDFTKTGLSSFGLRGDVGKTCVAGRPITAAA